jgi:hypothetical protein
VCCESLFGHRADKAKIIAENKKILKDQAINEAAGTLPNGVEFYELKTVKKLVEDDIEFDADTNQWVVRRVGKITYEVAKRILESALARVRPLIQVRYFSVLLPGSQQKHTNPNAIIN